MLTPPLRFAIVAVCLVYGAWSLGHGRIDGLIPILGALVLLWVHYRFGTVWLAFGALQKGDDEKARQLIDKVLHPDSLNDQHRAYFNWIKGVLAGKENDLTTARKFLIAAQDGELRTMNDRCIVACLLAEIALKLDDPVEARAQLDLVRSQPHKPQVDAMVEAIEAMMSEKNGAS